MDRDIQCVAQLRGKNKDPGVIYAGAHVEYRGDLQRFADSTEVIARVGGYYTFEWKKYEIAPTAWVDLGEDVAAVWSIIRRAPLSSTVERTPRSNSAIVWLLSVARRRAAVGRYLPVAGVPARTATAALRPARKALPD